MAATGTEAQIARALLVRLGTLSLSPSLPISYPDQTFTKPLDGSGKPLPYLEAAIMPAPTSAVTIAHRGLNAYPGILQVTVVHPQSSGVIKPAEIAAKIIHHFKRGTKMADGGTTVQVVQPPYASQTFKDEPYTRTPVTVRYQAFARQS